jgi:hypothetical protein
MPAADPQGNELMAFLTSISLTFNIWQSVRFIFGNINFRAGCGCLDLRISKVLSSNVAKEKILFIFRARRCFCAFKGLYCLDLRLGVKDLFMHKKHSLRALNIKITIYEQIFKKKFKKITFRFLHQNVANGV